MNLKIQPARYPIYLIDDDHSFVSSLLNILQIENYVVFYFDGVQQFLNSDFAKDSVIVCDMRMPTQNGLDLQQAFIKKNIQSPLIFLSGESSINQALAAIKNGAFDFITKPFEPSELIKTIDRAFVKISKDKYIESEKNKLSFRENQAMELFLKGFSNPEVAHELGIKVSTVKEYKANIFRKLEVKRMSDLIKKLHN